MKNDFTRKAFSFYESFEDCISELNEHEGYELYRAISRYSFYGESPRFNSKDLSPLARMAWKVIWPIVEAAREKSKIGSKGGKAKKVNNPIGINQFEDKQKDKQKDKQDKDKDKDKDKVEKEKATPTLPTSLPFDRLFGEISSELLGHGGDIWREEMTKAHGVTDFKVAFDQYRSYIIQNALENSIQSQGDFKRYFNWRAKEFLKDSAKKPKVEYFARIERLSDTKWVVHQYGGIDPIPVGTPDPPGPRYAWNGGAWEHI